MRSRFAAADGRHFVGPDNGLLIPAAEACGGVVEAVAITNPDVMLQPVSRTFHGRDVFAPAAARLAAGMPLAELGPAIEPARLVRRSTPDHRVEGSMLHAAVQYIDRFGNIQLAVSAGELDGLFQVGRMAEIDTGDDRYYARVRGHVRRRRRRASSCCTRTPSACCRSRSTRAMPPS